MIIGGISLAEANSQLLEAIPTMLEYYGANHQFRCSDGGLQSR